MRRPARKLLTPGPQTVQLLHPIGPEVPDDRHVQQVIDLCIRIGDPQHGLGRLARALAAGQQHLADAFGLSAVDVDVTFTAITICCHRGMAATPITSMRLVTHLGLDVTLLAKVYRLVEQVERGRALRPSAAALDEAVSAIHPYPRWVATTGAAGLAGALALLLGSPWVAVLAAAAVTAVIDVTGRYLAKRRLPAFFRQVVGGFLATGATAALFVVGVLPEGKVPPLVVALAGISPLLPGLTAYRGFYQLSVEGVADGLVTVTLALAIGLALAAGVTLGQFLTRPQATPLAPSDPARQGKRNQ